MKLQETTAQYCEETDKLLDFKIKRKNNLSRKRKVELKKLEKNLNIRIWK